MFPHFCSSTWLMASVALTTLRVHEHCMCSWGLPQTPEVLSRSTHRSTKCWEQSTVSYSERIMEKSTFTQIWAKKYDSDPYLHIFPLLLSSSTDSFFLQTTIGKQQGLCSRLIFLVIMPVLAYSLPFSASSCDC